MTESLALLHRLAENLDAVLIWALMATALMTTVLQGSQGMGLSRLSLPFLFGTFFTADRGRAVVTGSRVYLAGAGPSRCSTSSSSRAWAWRPGGSRHPGRHARAVPAGLVADDGDGPSADGVRVRRPGHGGEARAAQVHRAQLRLSHAADHVACPVLYGAILGGFLPMR